MLRYFGNVPIEKFSTMLILVNLVRLYVFDCRKALDLPTTDSKVACTQDVQLYNPQAATKAQLYQEPYNDLVRP